MPVYFSRRRCLVCGNARELTTASMGAETEDAVLLRRISFRARTDNTMNKRAAKRPVGPRDCVVDAISAEVKALRISGSRLMILSHMATVYRSNSEG